MTKKLFTILLWMGLTLAPIKTLAVTGSQYPSQVVKNQFGETSINSIIGGSSALDCSFVVDATNVNGLGISSLSGVACSAVYMHTSATPAVGNPNPASGIILVQLKSNYFGFVGGYSSFGSPVSGNAINVTTGVSAGLPYVITTLGNTSLSQWQKLGVPAGVTPAVGVAFVGAGLTTATGTGVIEAPATSGSAASLIDYVGNPGLSVSATGGASLLLRVLASTNSSTTTLVATAPADNTVIRLRFVMLPLSNQLK